ncbi:MAG: family N-acetyltransferase, partial [Sediminibacterium sp.]|nr:family N-acetyltransferase [Sediminibacterium sp.]
MSGPINNPAEIIPIGVADAPMLSALAKEIYREYYLHLWSPGGADWYMHEHAYHPDKLAAELAESDHLHFIVREKGHTAGYLTIRLRSSFGAHDEKDTMEIERIYLHKAFAGKGIGRKLMLHAEHIA